MRLGELLNVAKDGLGVAEPAGDELDKAVVDAKRDEVEQPLALMLGDNVTKALAEINSEPVARAPLALGCSEPLGEPLNDALLETDAGGDALSCALLLARAPDGDTLPLWLTDPDAQTLPLENIVPEALSESENEKVNAGVVLAASEPDGVGDASAEREGFGGEPLGSPLTEGDREGDGDDEGERDAPGEGVLDAELASGDALACDELDVLAQPLPLCDAVTFALTLGLPLIDVLSLGAAVFDAEV